MYFPGLCGTEGVHGALVFILKMRKVASRACHQGVFKLTLAPEFCPVDSQITYLVVRGMGPFCWSSRPLPEHHLQTSPVLASGFLRESASHCL
jgi:hypothetical protein